MFFRLSVLAASIFFILSSCQKKVAPSLPMSGALESMEAWAFERSYPNATISTDVYQAGLVEWASWKQQNTLPERSAGWSPIGPLNIGGRALALAFHPVDSNILFLGSASGGLWKSTTNGRGPTAWQYVPTGFPVLGVASIVIDPSDANTMYIGTGEVYGGDFAQPGNINRFTRGSYGIGILKTTNAGATWSKVWNATGSDLVGVQAMTMNPKRTNSLFAATSKGLLRTYNGGNSWQTVGSNVHASDVWVHPQDTNIVMVTYGSLLHDQSGVYRSVDGGNSFQVVTDLPQGYTGKARLEACGGDPSIMYISVADYSVSDVITPHGLYKSTNSGQNWQKMTNQNVPKFQGWYAHDIGIDPTNCDRIFYSGVDVYDSFDSGQTLTQNSNWFDWDFGVTPIGGPEGPPTYCHADVHQLYYSPHQAGHVFACTDGGLFVYEGIGWGGRNGGMQTQQFYADFGNSTTNENLAIGGMQDNATAVFLGDGAWRRVIGGDGMSAAVDVFNDQNMIGASQNLNLRKSSNGGVNFGGVNFNGTTSQDLKPFNGIFQQVTNVPNTWYAGTTRLFKSTDNGSNFNPVTNDFIAYPNLVVNMAIDPQNGDHIAVSMSPNPFDAVQVEPGIYITEDGGLTFNERSPLRTRIATDIAFHPTNPNIMYVTYSGFGTGHIFKTDDGGMNWEDMSVGLPNLPFNSVLIDPEIPQNVYVAHDAGIMVSKNGGQQWEAMANSLPDAVMAVHLSLVPSNRKIRVATHGNGVYEADLLPEVSSTNTVILEENRWKVAPNPILGDQLQLMPGAKNTLPIEAHLMQIVNAQGKMLYNGLGLRQMSVAHYPSGTYFVQLTESGRQSYSLKFVKQ